MTEGFDLVDFRSEIVWESPLPIPIHEFRDVFANTEYEPTGIDDGDYQFEHSDEERGVVYRPGEGKVDIMGSNLSNLRAAVDDMKNLLDELRADAIVQYQISGEAIIHHSIVDLEEDAAEAIRGKVTGPEIHPDFKEDGADFLSVRYSNADQDNSDPVIDIQVEPYFGNTEYFYVNLIRSSSTPEATWEFVTGLEDKLINLIKGITDASE